MKYVIYTTDNISGEIFPTTYGDGSPVVFATEDEAYEWGDDNYPSYFANHPNGWKCYGFQVERI